jgi:rod shape-determining protein MreC
MLRLFSFLYQQRNTILFLFLAAVAFYIVVRFNAQQQYAFGDYMLEVGGKVQQKRQGVQDYFRLGDLNRQLSDENIRLQHSIESLQKQINRYEGMLALDSAQFFLSDSLATPDTIQIAERKYLPETYLTEASFAYIPCHAIRNSVSRNYNYITLDKGRVDGVRPGMGLVSPQGVAGRVIRVSKNFSLALSTLNLTFKLSATALNSRYVGLFEWDGKSTRYGNLNNIPIDAPLQAGDTVVTSGYSTTFPHGFLIGVLEEPTLDAQGGYYEVRVKLSTEFQALGNLYIVSGLHTSALDSLEIELPE